MNLKKYAVITSIFVGLLLGSQSGATKTLADMTPKGDFPFELVFTLNKNQGPKCFTPPVLNVTVHRDHPEHTSTLILSKDSPYAGAKIISSSPYNTHEFIRRFHDEITIKAADGTKITMELLGARYVSKNIEQGTWSDNLGCSGSFTSTLK